MKRCLALVALLLPAACQLPARVVELGKPAIHIGSTRIGVALLPADYLALHPELEKLFDQPVVFDPYIDGKTIAKQLAGNRLDFAIVSAREFAEMPADTPVELVAAAVNPAGATLRKGLLITDATSSIQTPADCKGQRFAFGPDGDLLLHHAAVAALRQAGVQVADLKREIIPLSLTGRLHVGGGSAEIAKVVAFDGGIECGVVDEVTFNGLPETGGSLLSGASRDQLRVIGETQPVPELVVLAGSRAGPTKAGMLRQFLVENVKKNESIQKQMGVSGFADADPTLYADTRQLLANAAP